MPEPLKTERVRLDSLVEDPANARKHSARNLKSIAGSLSQFGQVEPLVVQSKSRRVIGGNGRLEAMRGLGWAECDVVMVDINDTQAAALGIALNRTGELASWDYEELARLLSGLNEDGFNLESIGWAPHELEPLLAADFAPVAKDDSEQFARTDDIIPGEPIKLTRAQRTVFERALERMKESTGDMEEGRCVELLAAEYLSGA